MRYDEISRLHVILMTVAYKHQRGEKITGETVWKALPDQFYALHRVVKGMKYLTDIGAIVWAEKSRGPYPGRVASIHPEKLGLKLQPSRTAAEREIKMAVQNGVFRYDGQGNLVLDAETLLTEDALAAIRKLKPDLDDDELFRHFDGFSVKKMLEMV